MSNSVVTHLALGRGAAARPICSTKSNPQRLSGLSMSLDPAHVTCKRCSAKILERTAKRARLNDLPDFGSAESVTASYLRDGRTIRPGSAMDF